MGASLGRQYQQMTGVAPSDGIDAWGITEYFNRGPQGEVSWDSSFLSVFLFWLLLPINLIVALIGTFSDTVFRSFAGWGMVSAAKGRPLYLAWVAWWYQPMVALRLIVRSAKSRFTLFNSSRAIMGGGDWWWHGEGAWNCPYASVRATMASDQKRSAAFGAVRAAVPEVFPGGNLLFLDGDEHRAVRAVLEAQLTSESNYGPRVKDLPRVIAHLVPKPCSLQTLTKDVSDKMVATCIWYLLFGVELSEAQAATAASWGGSGLAGYFVFPRFIHRVAFGLLMKKVRQLRIDTIAIVRSHGLESKFEEWNGMLGQYTRSSALELCDEFMYAVNFAGVGGTSHGCWAAVSFMRRQTIDVPVEGVTFPAGSLPEIYRSNPDDFIKEAIRLDAPVTSATCVFAKPASANFNVSCCAGVQDHDLKAGMLHQYVLSIANRDPSKFPSPNTFDPKRDNLDDMLGWNGALSKPEEYPRICPGQAISMVVIKAICSTLEDVGEGISA